MLFRSPEPDQREAHEAASLLFFTSEEGFDFGFGFDLRGRTRPPILDQREARAATDHAVYLGWKLWKSLRLARCISRAASVSDWVWAS